LVTAALARHSPSTVLVVIAHPRDLDAWAGDLVSFAGAAPAVLPAWDNGGSTSPADEVAGQRLRLLRQMQSASPPQLLLATFQALIQPVPARAALERNRRVVRGGDTVAPENPSHSLA